MERRTSAFRSVHKMLHDRFDFVCAGGLFRRKPHTLDGINDNHTASARPFSGLRNRFQRDGHRFESKPPSEVLTDPAPCVVALLPVLRIPQFLRT
jgi:hypothetical protein